MTDHSDQLRALLAEAKNKAGKALLHSAGLKIESKAPIINSKADAAHTVEAGANLTLKGALTKVN